MEENELQEIRLSLSQLPTETISRFLLKLIGSKTVDQFFAKTENVAEVVKILDKNALEDHLTAQFRVCQPFDQISCKLSALSLT